MFPFENTETRLQNELIELKKKRQQCLYSINQRQNEYSRNFDTKGEAYFDPATVYVFDEMDRKIQSYQKQELTQEQILEEINQRDSKAKSYLNHLQENELQLDEKPNENIMDQIDRLTKMYNKYIHENIRSRNELNDLQKRSNSNLK